MESVALSIKQEEPELHITDYGDSYVEDIKPICYPVTTKTFITDGRPKRNLANYCTGKIDSHTRGPDKSSLAVLKPVKLELVRLDDWYPGWSGFVNFKQELCDDDQYPYQEDADQDPLAFSLEERLSKFRKIKSEEKVPGTLQVIKVEKKEDLESDDATGNEDWDCEQTTDVDHLEQQDPSVTREPTTAREKVTTGGGDVLNNDNELIVPCMEKTSLLVKYKVNNNTQDKVYECKICFKTYSHRSSLWTHMRFHSGVKPFKCAYCDRCFVEKANLTVHIRTHTKERPYKCKVCSKTFRTRGAGKGHYQMLHCGLRHFSCDICGKSYALKQALVQHLKSHLEVEQKKIKLKKTSTNPCASLSQVLPKTQVCDQCGHRFGNAKLLKRHIRRYHNDKKKKYPCHKCGSTFPEPYSLQRHQNIHLKVKDYICILCDHSFVCRSYLTLHMKTIHIPKNLDCDLCGKTFFSKINLRNHIKRRHLICDSKRLRFECDQCDMCYRTNQNLQHHKKTHTVATLSACTLCFNKYESKMALREHVMDDHF